ncbi:chorion class B protein PC401-like [Cydia pomonella]|uniref:chorion class B protein PC401-like n=1 Tax=Cydia pomonella TaxID=82600 RepID=UPI002ADD59F9|nr:chorion class B protein PC401-like [Cydia pomonella]
MHEYKYTINLTSLFIPSFLIDIISIMIFKVIIFYVFASLTQSITAQSGGCNCRSISIPNSGGALNIQAIGPVVPSGIAVATDLVLSGDLDLSGTLPYLSAVAFEGQFDTTGSTPVSYGCGDCVAITKQFDGFSNYGCELLHVRNKKLQP